MIRVAAAALGGLVAAAAWAAARARPPGGAEPWTRTNFRGAPVSLLLGPAAVLGLAAGLAVGRDRTAYAGLVAAVGAGAAGLLDDLRGDPGTKGLAGHLRALARGRVTSGSAKLVLIGLVGLGAGMLLGGSAARRLAAGLLVAGCANLLNLLDLRPGRALKVAVATLLPLAVVVPTAAVGVGVAAALLPWDLRERGMLGDAGANALGGVAGVCLAAATGSPVALGVALGVVVALTLASEVVSYSRVIDGVPALRWLDRLGRPA